MVVKTSSQSQAMTNVFRPELFSDFWAKARSLAAVDRDALSLISAAASELAPYIPPEIRKELVQFKLYGNSFGGLLLRNFFAPEFVVGPTPKTVEEAAQSVIGRATSLGLIALNTVLGDSFAFEWSGNGQLVKHMIPLTNSNAEKHGVGAGTFLEWHSELPAVGEARPAFLALLCLRGDERAATGISAVDNLSLDVADEKILCEKRFVILDVGNNMKRGPIPVLSGSSERRHIEFDPDFTVPYNEDDQEAMRVIHVLREEIDEAGVFVTLKPGDFLVVDNYRAVHARTSFEGRRDGTDRWVLHSLIGCSPHVLRQRQMGSADLSVMVNEVSWKD